MSRDHLLSYLLFAFSFISISVVQTAPQRKSTAQWKQCKRSDPQFLQCFTRELQQALPAISDGYPKFRIPAIEPFDLPQLDIAKGQGAVSVDLSLQKIKIYGLSSAIIQNFQVDVDKLKAYFKLGFSKPISLIGQYTAKGKVQVLPINGKGPCNITLYNPILEVSDLRGDLVDKNGQQFIDLKTLNLKVLSLGKLYLKLDNLFQGNKELSDNLNVFLNENWQLLFDELKPAFEEAIGLIIKDIASKSLMKIPKDQIFPQ